jgi:hypothetical protein
VIMTFECLRSAGNLGPDDLRIVEVFRTFLTETPKGVTNDFGHARRYFETPEAFNAWRQRWLPYLAGLTDGPTTPDEYTEHLPKLRRWWEEWQQARDAADRARKMLADHPVTPHP